MQYIYVKRMTEVKSHPSNHATLSEEEFDCLDCVDSWISVNVLYLLETVLPSMSTNFPIRWYFLKLAK